MYDGNDMFEVRAQLEVPDETIAIDGGNFHATRIDVHLYQHGRQVEKTDLSMWFENNAVRTPLLLKSCDALRKNSRRTRLASNKMTAHAKRNLILGDHPVFGRKVFCQNFGAGFSNSMPICALPACIAPT